MHTFLKALLLAATLPLVSPFLDAAAQAHAVYAQSPSGVHPQVVAFEYATGDIPAYVQVEVFAPGEADVEFQNGRTDALGRFTFTPDKPGVWAVVMSDGMGHQLRHEVTVPEALFTPDSETNSKAQASAATSGAAPAGAAVPTAATGGGGLGTLSTPWKALVGVSVLCNIFLGMGLWRRRHAPVAKS